MVWYDADDENRVLVVDLHGYSGSTALQALYDKIEEAWASGFEAVKAIHGAPDVDVLDETYVGDRGTIKRDIITLLDIGSLHEKVERYDAENGSTVIFLEPNPAPSEPQWGDMPAEEHGVDRKWNWSRGTTAPRYTADQVRRDAQAIVEAIVTDTHHEAVSNKGEIWTVTMSRVIPDASQLPRETLDGRRKRLKAAIRDLMEQRPEFEEITHGSRIAYKRKPVE